MSDAPDSDQKTQEPTEKRKRDAAGKGDKLRSKELSTAAVMLLGSGYLAFAGPMIAATMAKALKGSLSFSRDAVTDFRPFDAIGSLVLEVALPVAGLFAVCMFAAIAAQAVLGSFQVNGKLLQPKFSRINPGAGLKRMFGTHGLVELGKSLLKVTLLGAVGLWIVWSMAHSILATAHQDILAAIRHGGHLAAMLLLLLSVGLGLIAAVDVPLQMVQLMKKLRMTLQEVKDEYKETEGSPESKQAMRRRQHDAASGSMAKAVATANVVLTNPTEFAVALRYDQTRDRAPIVVAKGRGATAAAIKGAAKDAKVSTLEYPLLARALYFTTRVDQEIRDDLYIAVATVLAFVFSLSNTGEASIPRPQVDVPDGARFDEHGKPLAAKP